MPPKTDCAGVELKKSIIMKIKNVMQKNRNLNNFKMEKFFYGALMVVALSLSQVANAQINLEHTFNGNATHYGSGSMIGNNTGADLYGYVQNSSNQIMLYNEDYSLYKAITITPPAGYNINSSISFVSKSLFNSDNKIEFIVTFINPSALQQGGDYNTYCSCKMYNEDGSLIKDFGTSYQVLPWSIVKTSSGDFKLLILRHVYNTTPSVYYDLYTDVYSLSGTLPLSVSVQNNMQFQPPYPNPANATITLPYQLKQGEISQMNIYNINGQLIETKQIGYDYDKVLLNVSSYTKGVYIYQVNGISNRFIVE
jgi:hypothetical protein